MVTVREPPLRHARELAEGEKPMPDVQARKQHYGPSFFLAPWATPQSRCGVLSALTVATGDIARRKPGNEASEKDLYTLDKDIAPINRVVEALLGIIEQHAADAIKRREAAPRTVSDDDPATIAHFLAIEQGRDATRTRTASVCGARLSGAVVPRRVSEPLGRRRALPQQVNPTADIRRSARLRSERSRPCRRAGGRSSGRRRSFRRYSRRRAAWLWRWSRCSAFC